MIGGMPVTGRDRRQAGRLELPQVSVEHGHYGIAIGYGETAARPLHVNDNQCVASSYMQTTTPLFGAVLRTEFLDLTLAKIRRQTYT
jgi:hypothetical protein